MSNLTDIKSILAELDASFCSYTRLPGYPSSVSSRGCSFRLFRSSIEKLGNGGIKPEHADQILIPKYLNCITMAYSLRQIISSLGGGEISPYNADKILVPKYLGYIRNNEDLNEIVDCLGGKKISSYNADRILIPGLIEWVLIDVQGPAVYSLTTMFYLLRLIQHLGGKDISSKNLSKILTERVLSNIESLYGFTCILGALEGHISSGNLEKLLTKAVLDGIKNMDDIYAVIEALGGKDIPPENLGKLLSLTEAVWATADSPSVICGLIEKFGGKDITLEHARLILTDAVIGSMQSRRFCDVLIAFAGKTAMPSVIPTMLLRPEIIDKIICPTDLILLIKTLCGENINAATVDLFLPPSMVAKIEADHGFNSVLKLVGVIKDVTLLCSVIRALDGKTISAENARQILTLEVLNKINTLEAFRKIYEFLKDKLDADFDEGKSFGKALFESPFVRSYVLENYKANAFLCRDATVDSICLAGNPFKVLHDRAAANTDGASSKVCALLDFV